MKKRNFSAEFKRESAQLVVDQNYTVADAASAMDVGLSTMTRWVKQLRDERQGKTPKASPITPEQIEIRELRKKLQRIEMENEILKSYSPIIEKIVVEQEAIPYETITKDASQGVADTKNKVIQQGEDGIKEITYKVKYQNEEEIEKIKLSETVIKEPIDRIVQIQRNITSRAGSTIVNSNNNGTTKIFKVTAYCSCAKCCGKTTGITASGTKATAGRTVAASGQFAFGTKLIINGQEYTVEDRGGAIQGNRIDVYMNSHAEALAWGVKYLPVQVAE
mgnify:CR=1 FL=1